MSVRVRYSLEAAISSTCNEERDLGNSQWHVLTDEETKGGTWRSIIPAGATNVILQMDNITTIQLMIIRTTTVDPNALPVGINIALNSTGGPTFLVKPLGNAPEGHMLMSTDSITALYASNPGTVDMQITLTLAGV